jgi:hypothetical protein
MVACVSPAVGAGRRQLRIRPGSGRNAASDSDADLVHSGSVALHPLDVANMRLCMSGAWRFDSLLDVGVMEAALAR